MTFLPQEKTGMVILTNLNGNVLPSILSYAVWDRVLGLPPVDWSARFTV